MKNIIKSAVMIMLAGTFFCSSCKVASPVVLPQPVLPTAYGGAEASDTTSLAELPWRKLFNDPYLVRLIDSTLANNLDLQRATQRINVAQQQYRLRLGAFRPRVDVRVAAGADRFGKYTMTGVGNFDTNLSGNINKKQRTPVPVTPDYFAGLQSSWEIDLWGKLKSLKKAAYIRYLSSREGIHLLQTTLVAEVSKRYFELLALDNEMKIISKNIRLQTTALEIVQVQKQAGRANELAVQQFRAQLLNTRALVGNNQLRITAIENELNVLQGRYPGAVSRDTAFKFDQFPTNIQAGLPSQLIFRRPDIRQAEQELAALNADVMAARASFYPSLVISPYLGVNSFKLPLLFNPASIVFGMLGNLTAPVFSQGMLKGNYAIADAARKEAYYAYQQAVLGGVREVSNNLSSIQNLINVFHIKQEEVNVLNDAVSTSILLFKTGKASYLEVIAAQRNVIEAELQLIETKEEMFKTLADFYRALGGGWEQNGSADT